MKKIIKKTMSMAVAMMIVVGVFVSATFAFAANENVSNRYDKVNGKIRGTVNLSKVVKSDGREVVKFPRNFKVNVNSIDVSANTRTISKITKTYNSADNSVTFVFNLGNWNDYREFFELYEKEKGTEGHEIKIKMPYSVEIKDQSVKNLGRISAEGKCELFYKKLFFEKKIVDISAEKIDFDITR